MVIADTHAVVWLLLDTALLSEAAASALDAASSTATVGISAISLVEITYLVEKGRIRAEAATTLQAELASSAPRISVVPVGLEVANALTQVPRDIVPDMPDRIIAATALHLELPLVTRDERIRSLPIPTVW